MTQEKPEYNPASEAEEAAGASDLDAKYMSPSRGRMHEHMALVVFLLGGALMVFLVWQSAASIVSVVQEELEKAASTSVSDSGTKKAGTMSAGEMEERSTPSAFEHAAGPSYDMLLNKDTAPLAHDGPRVVLSECGQLAANTHYVLEEDLLVDAEFCLMAGGAKDGKLIPADNITLDCQGHSMISTADRTTNRYQHHASLLNATELVVQNCVLESPRTLNSTQLSNSAIFHCFSCEDALFRNNVVQGQLSVRDSNNITVRNNVFFDGVFRLFNSGNGRVTDNVFDGVPSFRTRNGAQAEVQEVRDVLIADNSFDGVSLSMKVNDGYDNAVMIIDSEAVTVASNTTNDHWGCAIELAGVNDRHSIVDNTITSAGTCGIGGWWWISLRDNVISRNSIRTTPALFNFTRVFGLRSFDTHPYFANNTFDSNVLEERYAIPKREQNVAGIIRYDRLYNELKPVALDPGDVSQYREPAADEYEVSGNIFTNNTFDTEKPVLIQPAGLVETNEGNVWDLRTSY